MAENPIFKCLHECITIAIYGRFAQRSLRFRQTLSHRDVYEMLLVTGGMPSESGRRSLDEGKRAIADDAITRPPGVAGVAQVDELGRHAATAGRQQ